MQPCSAVPRARLFSPAIAISFGSEGANPGLGPTRRVEGSGPGGFFEPRWALAGVGGVAAIPGHKGSGDELRGHVQNGSRMSETKSPGEKRLSVSSTKTLTLKRGVE